AGDLVCCGQSSPPPAVSVTAARPCDPVLARVTGFGLERWDRSLLPCGPHSAIASGRQGVGRAAPGGELAVRGGATRQPAFLSNLVPGLGAIAVRRTPVGRAQPAGRRRGTQADVLKYLGLAMMSKLELKEDKMLEVQFVGDDDVLNHILDREGGTKFKKERPQLLVNTKKIVKKPECDLEEDDQEVLKDQNYVEVLGRDVQASELAKTPRKSVALNLKNDPEIMINIPQSSKDHSASDEVQLKNNDKSEFLSTAPRVLRKRLTVTRSHSDSESEYSTSNSEDDEEVAQEFEENTSEVILSKKIQAHNQIVSAPICKETPCKKIKRDKTSDLVEEYFEAHSSSKVLTSDRTLQKLQRAKLDQETLHNLLSKVSPSFSSELKQLNQQYEQLFHKWMLQLHLGFNIVLYGLGSKRDLLERFRTTMLQNSIHIVINGFFPGISVKSILNSITEEVLDHMGTFRSVLDQLDWIINKFKEDSSLELFLLIHNLDSQTLRGDKSQQIIGQLSSLRNIYLITSIDHINAPLRLSFQDFYQQCREAFLVNSDLTLRAQLTEFRDHKLIRTKKGTDGVEYLLIPVDNGTLTDFLEREEEES
ncbi:Origin recognition complex subunit 2, partial [Galemys pyrenaicus]